MAPYWAFLVLGLSLQTAWGRPVSPVTETDADAGEKRNIIDINKGLDLMEGDIMVRKFKDRNSIVGDQYRWPQPVPYYLNDSLEMNAKALILKAIEQFRLKTSIDFKPWEGEPNYISLFKGSGCWSYVGNQRTGKQDLSIGQYCDTIAIIEHELLHALGFWHEHTRADRDDYVTIMWDQIMPGEEHNFDKYSNSDALNVSYDFTSVMHYDKNAFSTGNLPTIVTKDPQFTNVIGQRLDLSERDILKLNKLYNSNSSVTFLDQCSFESDSICDMIQGTGDDADWKFVTQVPGKLLSDHTYLGSNLSGHFMHFSTATGSARDKAYLESKTFQPKRSFQCLQFFSYHSGSADDQLNVWIREYDSAHPTGTLRLMGRVTGSPGDSWQLHHIPLNATKPFRVVFEGRKGAGSSSGGLSIDDVNLSETQCPAHTWHIRNFTQLLETTKPGSQFFSPRFQSNEGYTFQISVYVNGTTSYPGNLAVFFHLTSGENDDRLQWPCAWRQGTMLLMDQNPDIRKQMSNQRSITTDPEMSTITLNGSSRLFWDDPRKVGNLVTDENGTLFYRSPGYGYNVFISHDRLRSREFIKGDDVFFLLTMEDVSRLRSSQTLWTTTQPSTIFEPTTEPSTFEPTTPDLCNVFWCWSGSIFGSSPGMAASSLLLTVSLLASLLQ